MKTVILASGPSLNDEDIEYVRQARMFGRVQNVIAVSDVGIKKAEWADALVSHDTSWWLSKKGSFEFKGRKFSAQGYKDDVEKFDIRFIGIAGSINSGVFGMYIARDIFLSSELFLLGFDLHRRNGQHFFGPHTETYNNRTLINSDEKKFAIHIRQFDKFSGCQVFNCTEGSDLKRFPFSNIRDKF